MGMVTLTGDCYGIRWIDIRTDALRTAPGTYESCYKCALLVFGNEETQIFALMEHREITGQMMVTRAMKSLKSWDVRLGGGGCCLRDVHQGNPLR